jgi:hypothetical protein
MTHLAVVETLPFLLCPLIIHDSNSLGRAVSSMLAQRALELSLTVIESLCHSDTESTVPTHIRTSCPFLEILGVRESVDDNLTLLEVEVNLVLEQNSLAYRALHDLAQDARFGRALPRTAATHIVQRETAQVRELG